MGVDKKEVGYRIKKIRLSLGEKTEDFGKNFGPIANRSLVSAWENGRYLPSAERLKAIAELGNITVEELLYGSEQMKLTANINFKDVEPFKSYLVQMTTYTDYIDSKQNKTVLEQRILESHRAFMKQLESR